MFESVAASPPTVGGIESTLCRLVAVGLFLVTAGCGSASSGEEEPVEEYASRQVTILSWVTPGSPTDLLARALAQSGEEHFGQRIRVLNRPGSGGAVAMRQLLAAPPDGYTLAIMTASGVVNMATGNIPYEPRDFRQIARIQLDPYMIAVPSDSPFTTLQEFFDHAEENPGGLSIAGFGTTSGHFLAFSRLQAAAGDSRIQWIAYEGSADAAVASLGGHTDAVHTTYNVIREHLRAGTMRVLATASPMGSLPDVPTYRDLGYDLAPVHWRGVMAPAGLPDELVSRIRELLEQTVEEEEFQAFVERSSTELGFELSPAELQAMVARDVDETRGILIRLGVVSEDEQ